MAAESTMVTASSAPGCMCGASPKYSVRATTSSRSTSASVSLRISVFIRHSPQVVGFDDLRHQRMPDDVLAAQFAELQVLYSIKDVADDLESAAGLARQVDLGDVTGDDHA